MSEDLQTLVGKVLSDENFATALAENPEQALQEAGIDPTPELLEALQGIDAESLKSLAAAFGDGQAAAA